MEIIGRLIEILPEQSGTSARGQWVRGGFVIETEDNYPKKVAFTSFGEDKIAMIKGLQMNTSVIVNFSPESREFQGRWYTDLRCISVRPNSAAQTYQAPVQPQQQFSQPAPAPAQPAQQQFVQENVAEPFGEEPGNDLPF